MSDAPVFLSKEGTLAWLVLNRPDKLNAMSQAMWSALPALVQKAENDPAIKVIILKGATDEAFSAGADISEFEALNSDEELRDANRAAITAGLRSLHEMKKPTIAMIRGICMGGGCAMALACDLRFASPESRFGIPPARLGLAYSLEETRHLVDVVGPANAKSILFTARRLQADEALRMGLINEVYGLEDIEDQTRQFAAAICDNSQYSVRAIKQIIRLAQEGQVRDNDESWALVLGAYEGEDYKEGVAAFMAKRSPGFKFS